MKNFQIYNSTSSSELGIYQGETEYDALVALNNDMGGNQESLESLIEANDICVEEVL